MEQIELDSKQTNMLMNVTPDMLMDFEQKSVKPKVKVFLKSFLNGENECK